MRKPNGYWNYENCYNAAKECENLAEFYTKYAGAYDKAINKGWIDDYVWFKGFHKGETRHKWTYDEAYEIAKKYKYKSDFHKYSRKAYDMARKYGWMEDYTWFIPKLVKEPCNKGSVYWIYGYFDFCEKVCYIGLSRDKNRHWRHKQKDIKGKFDSAMLYFNGNYGFLPEPTIIEEALTADEAQEKEAYYIQLFLKKGYTLLNRMKAGSLGSAIVKWNKAACYEEAKKYSNYDDFYNNSPSAYKNAKEKGWIDEYTWLQRKYTKRNYWQDYNNCLNEAKKYNRISEFQEKAPGAYRSANDNGWIDDYTWFVRNASKAEFTYDICYDLAKKCKNTTEFMKASSTAYKAAKENDWLKDYVWFKEIVRWTDEEVIKLACKYSSAVDFRKENSGAYNYMQKHSLQKPNSWKDNKPQWTYDTCYAEALKYKKRSEYRKNSKTSYNVARDNGWLNEFTWLKVSSKPHGYWTYERCREEAKKYKTKREFEKGSPGAYDAVITHKWMEDFEYLFVYGRKPKGYWNNYDNCYKEALKYSKVSHFKKSCMGAYSSSLKHDWIKDYTWFNNNSQLNLFE